MKSNFTVVLCFLMSIVYAQNDYYYYKGEKIPLTLNKKSLNISVSQSFKKSSIGASDFKSFKLENEIPIKSNELRKYSKLEFKESFNDVEYYSTIESLKGAPDVRSVMPNYITVEGLEVGMSDYFYIKLKAVEDMDLLKQLVKKNHIEFIEQNKYMPLWVTLRCSKQSNSNTLEIANQFYETGLFASAVPDFLYDDREILCTNDTDFGDLWGLDNVGNPDADINACAAWGITEGSGVVVAILDQGIEMTHGDLSNNISPLSYDTESDSSPAQMFGYHGTHVAGTVAAVKDNDLQVVGVAPQATLMSVSNSLRGIPNSRIARADGINWAWQNGADIINNSWGSGIKYQVIDDAIENAQTNGRDGLGTIIAFATGNSYGAVAYPANANPNILAVGSITSAGSRSSFSNYGDGLDIVAPGSLVLSTANSNGTRTLSGTSMASPHAAGVAALIISVNPDLTGEEVMNIMGQTAQKVAGYTFEEVEGKENGTWNDEMGYGLIDAHAAVLAAQETLVNTVITGPKAICALSPEAFTLEGVKPGASVTWEYSHNVDLISSDDSEILVKSNLTPPDNPYNDYRFAWVKATVDGKAIQHDFWLGTPNPVVVSEDPAEDKIYTRFQSFGIIFRDVADQLPEVGYGDFQFELADNSDFEYSGQFSYIVNVYSTVFDSDLDLDFKVRMKNECGWAPWKSFHYDLKGSFSPFSSTLFSVQSDSPGEDFNIIIHDDSTNDLIAKGDQTLSSIEEPFDVEIVDMYGSVRYKQIKRKNETINIDRSAWPAGIYYVKVSNSKGDSQTKGVALQ